MSNTNKILDKINDAIEEAIKPILGKGAAMTAAELEVLMKSICAIEKIKQMEDAEIATTAIILTADKEVTIYLTVMIIILMMKSADFIVMIILTDAAEVLLPDVM